MARQRSQRQVNGPSTGFDFKDMQDQMLRKRMSFRELQRATQIAEAKLRRIASGFVVPSSGEAGVIAGALAEESEHE